MIGLIVFSASMDMSTAFAKCDHFREKFPQSRWKYFRDMQNVMPNVFSLIGREMVT